MPIILAEKYPYILLMFLSAENEGFTGGIGIPAWDDSKLMPVYHPGQDYLSRSQIKRSSEFNMVILLPCPLWFTHWIIKPITDGE